MFLLENWVLKKPSIKGSNGLVATQHYIASEVGAEILRRGGNAIDASVGAGLALGTVEPWMSGIGGGGFITFYSANNNQTFVIEFGMKAPLDVSSDDYPLTGKATGASSFNWPEVKDNINVHGPMSIAVPGYIRGIALALEHFGTWEWKDIVEPACKLAEAGMPMNWYASHFITQTGRLLRNYSEANRTFLGDGLPPVLLRPDGSSNTVTIGRLKETLRLLQREGPDSFYNGQIADLIAVDLERAGSKIRSRDLREYSAYIDEPISFSYRKHRLHAPRRRSAGPTLKRALDDFASRGSVNALDHPDSQVYVNYTQTLLDAYAYRLEHLGDGKEKGARGATSHLCVADKDGNLVSQTQTIMSTFGSLVMLPQTGILMNNGMMWFDPVAGKPNSVAGGRRPLSNMCPVIGELNNGSKFALGACGGRTIFPSVFQIASFLCDFDMTVEEALHQPRVDVSGTDLVSIMESMDSASIDLLNKTFANTRTRSNGVAPVLFGVPQLIMQDSNGNAEGGCFIPSPTASVAVA